MHLKNQSKFISASTNILDYSFFAQYSHAPKKELNLFYMHTLNPSELKLFKKLLAQDHQHPVQHNHFFILGKGGEGIVFENILDDNQIIKIYKKEKSSDDIKKKLTLMTEKIDINHEGICWPLDLLDINGRTAYSSPKAKGIDLALLVRKPIMEEYKFIDRKYMVNLGIDIIEKIQYLHKKNILLGDINLQNILVDIKRCKSFFVDTDSYQIANFRCPVGSVAFTAPEIQHKNFKTFERTIENENFAIATLLFILLHAGQSPYTFKGGSTPQKNIAEQNFTYPYGQDITNLTPDGIYENMWNMLSSNMKKAFYDCFKSGLRPSTKEWSILFYQYRNEIDAEECVNDLFPTSYSRTSDHTNFNYDNKKFESMGDAKNIINENGEGFGILELGTKAGKLLYYRESSYYEEKRDFNFTDFHRQANLTYTSSTIQSDDNIIMDINNPASYPRAVFPQIDRLIRKAKNDNIKELHIYGGAFFRAAKNRDKLLDYYKTNNLSLRIQSPEEEAKHNLEGYLLSQDINNLEGETCFIDWGSSSFRLTIYDSNNEPIYSHSTNRIGAKALLQLFTSNNSPDMHFHQALYNYDAMIVDYIDSIFNEYPNSSINNIEKIMGTGQPFKRTTYRGLTGNTTVAVLHNKSITELKISEKQNIIDEYLDDLPIVIGDIPNLIYRMEHANSYKVRRNKELQNIKKQIKNLEHRLCLPVLSAIMKKFNCDKIRFSGTGVWYGSFKSVLSRYKNC
jgi:serine/threonine protein kinase